MHFCGLWYSHSIAEQVPYPVETHETRLNTALGHIAVVDATRGAAGATAGVGVALEIGVSGTCQEQCKYRETHNPCEENIQWHGDPWWSNDDPGCLSTSKWTKYLLHTSHLFGSFWGGCSRLQGKSIATSSASTVVWRLPGGALRGPLSCPKHSTMAAKTCGRITWSTKTSLQEAYQLYSTVTLIRANTTRMMPKGQELTIIGSYTRHADLLRAGAVAQYSGTSHSDRKHRKRSPATTHQEHCKCCKNFSHLVGWSVKWLANGLLMLRFSPQKYPDRSSQK